MAINSKLKTWKFSSPELCFGKHTPRGNPDALVIIRIAKERSSRIPVQFKLASKLLTEAGFKKGDMLDLQYDDGVTVLCRCANGRKLHSPSSSGRATVEFNLPPVYSKLFTGKRAGSIEVEPGRVAFVVTD